jgi:cold shock CspA family protein
VLKFFNEVKNYGFFVEEQTGEDVFFYFDDVKETKLSKEFLKESKNKFLTKFSFQIQEYFGKHSNSTRPSKKAINIQLLGIMDLRFLKPSLHY